MNRCREFEVAISAVLEAGEVLMRYFKNKNYHITYKSKFGKSPVTDADIKSNEILKRNIVSAFPDDGWFSEETADDMLRLEKRRVWIVDPLDGTKSFIRGVSEFTISIALVEDRIPIVGVVYNPPGEELYFASRGNGAYLFKGDTLRGLKNLNVEEIKDYRFYASKSKKSVKEAVIIASRGEIEKNETLKNLVGKFGEVRFRKSIAYKIVSVAIGWADALVSLSSKNEWDIAGAHVIAEEAGLKVTDSFGEKIFYNERNAKKKGIIVANEILHNEILKILNLRK